MPFERKRKRIIIDVQEKFHTEVKTIAAQYNTTIKHIVLELLAKFIIEARNNDQEPLDK
jgi:hypothetical protein